MKANPNLQFLVLKPEPKSLNDFIQMLKQIFLNLSFVINGHIGFGDGTLPDNVDGNWVNVTTPVAPNTDFTVDHNLGRLPVGYVPMQKDRAVDIYTGSVPSTKTQLTLRATVASALVRLFIVCLVLAIPTFGQSTSVTVNVTDSSGQVWIGGNYKIGFWTNPSFPNGYQWQGAPFNQTTIFTGVMDGSGNFTVSIPDNSTISPSGSAWKFTVCPLATFPCFDQIIGVSGTSQNLNIVPPPILISPTAVNSAYQTTQSKAGLGALMYKITDGHLYVCTASAPYRVDPSESCTGGSSWVPLCEPGDGLCGGGTGCTVSGLLDTWIVFIHPDATCTGSTKLTWDNTNEDLSAGNANTFNGAFCQTCSAIGDNHSLASGNTGATFSEHTIGYQNVLGMGVVQVYGDQNTVKGDEVVVLGQSNSLNAAGLSTHFVQSIIAENDMTLTLSGTNAEAIDLQMIGHGDTITIGDPDGHISQVNCLHGIGGGNVFTIPAGVTLNTTIQQVNWVGKNNHFSVASGDNMSVVTVAGSSNTLSGAIQTAGVYGHFFTLAACIDCYALGENASLTSSDNASVNIGMSASPEVKIKANNFTLKKLPFSSLPACAAGTEGSLMPVTDSTTIVWGATITGGSTGHVLAYCDGTNWTVAAK